MQKDTQHPAKTEPLVQDDITILQDNLFTGVPTVIAEPPDPLETPFPPLIRTHPLTDQSSLAACTIPYSQELMLRGKSNYTVTCFLSDLKLFSSAIGKDTPVGRITKEQLTDWLMQLKFGTKDRTPAPKTMARRVTFLKNFFSWLAREGVIHEDPSASLALERPLPPLPELLYEDEVKRLLEAAAEDARCHCLVYLVLHAGLKKEEVMGLKIHQIDLSDPHHPAITIDFPASTGQAASRAPSHIAGGVHRYSTSISGQISSYKRTVRLHRPQFELHSGESRQDSRDQKARHLTTVARYLRGTAAQSRYLAR